MFRFATGIKSLTNLDPTLELEEMEDSRSSTSRHQFPPTTKFAAKQTYLVNKAVETATRLRGTKMFVSSYCLLVNIF